MTSFASTSTSRAVAEHAPATTDPLSVAIEPWLTKKQLARHLGFSTRWVELRLRDGLPSRLIGGRRRFRLSEVERWVDGRQPSTHRQ
jgi:hypothetical protein